MAMGIDKPEVKRYCKDDMPETIYHCPECLDSNWSDIGSHRVSCHQSGRRKYEYILKSEADKQIQELRDRIKDLLKLHCDYQTLINAFPGGAPNDKAHFMILKEVMGVIGELEG